MKKRIIHVLNWDKYQARADKELPWCKLWGTLFKRPWFQELPDDEKFVTIVFLDLARQFNNRIPDLSEFKGYLKGNYGVFMSEERVFKLCKLLSHNEFLSDNTSALQDKTRQDKTREETCTEVVKQKKQQKETDEEWITSLKANPLYSHVSFEREFKLMDDWLLRHPDRVKSRGFILNWVKKVEKPINTPKKPSIWDMPAS